MLALVSVLLSKGWLLSGALGVGAIVIELLREIVCYFGLRPSAGWQDFPLFCKVIVDIEETINANFAMTGGDYLIFPSPAQGAFKVILYLRPNDFEKYKNIMSQNKQVKLQAGFVAIENLQKIEQVEEQPVNENASRLVQNLICLDMEMTFQEFKQLKKLPQQYELVNQKYNINRVVPE